MDARAEFINSVLTDAREKARRRIAEAVGAALYEYHEHTGGHIVGINLELAVSHRVFLVDSVMLEDVHLDCTVGAKETS